MLEIQYIYLATSICFNYMTLIDHALSQRHCDCITLSFTYLMQMLNNSLTTTPTILARLCLSDHLLVGPTVATITLKVI